MQSDNYFISGEFASDESALHDGRAMTHDANRLEPRWPAMLALLAVGPGWLLITVVGVLLIPTTWARQSGKDNQIRFWGT
jgi:hypothetical protein